MPRSEIGLDCVGPDEPRAVTGGADGVVLCVPRIEETQGTSRAC